MPRPASYSTRAPACASREYAGWRTPRGDDEVAVDRARPSIATAPTSPRAARRDPRRRAVAQSTTPARSTPARSSRPVTPVKRSLVGADHDRPPARADRPLVDQPLDGRGEHHADEVVAGEHERLLDRARRDHDPARADPMEDGAGVDRDEPALVDAECMRGGEHVVRPLSGLQFLLSTPSSPSANRFGSSVSGRLQTTTNTADQDNKSTRRCSTSWRPRPAARPSTRPRPASCRSTRS
jgi:hypothetical protein